jgi:hypothetical protein
MFRSRTFRSQSTSDSSVKSASPSSSPSSSSSSQATSNTQLNTADVKALSSSATAAAAAPTVSTSNVLGTSGGNVTSEPSDCQPLKTGVVRKFRSKRKKYLVLWAENATEPFRIEYFDSEKKFRVGNRSHCKRTIRLTEVFAILRKHDPIYSRKLHVFALYTKDDCFGLCFDDQSDCDSWFSVLHEIHSMGTRSAAIPTPKITYGKTLF